MPKELMKKVAKRTGKSVKKIERDWRKIANETGGNYAIATAAIKKEKKK